ncbi:hypothetical protein C8Q75DRAFT_809108 [Abortiporus biennis]|nr:hypothetical protein C8Q75DRAFT_809108 [Abortiporus biennis]
MSDNIERTVAGQLPIDKSNTKQWFLASSGGLLNALKDLKTSDDDVRSLPSGLDLETLNDLDTTLAFSLSIIRSFKNRIAPIQKLPPELLTRIFDTCRSPFPFPPSPPWADRGDTTSFHIVTDWFYVSHVCRAWREVSLGYHLLWSSIMIDSNKYNTDLARLFLGRTGECLLDICISSIPDTEMNWLGETLKEYAPRIRSLYYNRYLLTKVNLNLTYPNLNRLVSISTGCCSPPREDPKPEETASRALTISGVSLPKVRQLCIDKLDGWSGTRLQTQLTHLCLKFCSATRVKLGLVLEAIAGNPTLEEIMLSIPGGALPLLTTSGIQLNTSGEISDADLPIPVAKLNRLQRLAFSQCSTDIVSTVLSYTIIPDGVAIRILDTAVQYDTSPTRATHSIEQILGSKFTKEMLPGTTQICLVVKDGLLSVFFLCDKVAIDGRFHVNVPFTEAETPDVPAPPLPPFLELISSIGHLVSLDRIEKLDIEVPCPCADSERPSFWWLSSLANLKHLSFIMTKGGYYPPDGTLDDPNPRYPIAVFTALRPQRSSSSPEDNLDSTTAIVPSPHLNSIVITGVDAADDARYWSVFREIMDERVKAGVKPLKKVRALFVYDSWQPAPGQELQILSLPEGATEVLQILPWADNVPPCALNIPQVFRTALHEYYWPERKGS